MRNFKQRTEELLASSLSRQEKARLLARIVQLERHFHWVGLYDVSKTNISAIAWTGDTPPAYPTFPITKGINGAAIAEKKPVVVQDVSKDARYLTTFGQTQAEAIFPIFSDDGTVVGTIDVESERVHAFSSDDVDFLNECVLLLASLWNSHHGAP